MSDHLPYLGLDIAELLFLLGVAMTIWVILQAHRSPNGWDFFDTMRTDGHADGRKLMFMVVGFSMVWVMFYLTIHDRLTEWFLLLLVGGYVAADANALWARRYGKGSPDEPPKDKPNA